MSSKRVEFEGTAGKLHGYLEQVVHPRAYALFAHCFTCSKDVRAARTISRALAQQGIATLRFDFTGLGESEGNFEDTNFSSNVQDLILAAEFLRDQFEIPQLLVGHSLGGAAVLAAAPKISGVLAVATIGAPAEPAHVRHLLKDAEVQLEENDVADIVLAGREFRIKGQFLRDIEENRLLERLGSLKRALLVFHSPQDELVGVDNAKRIYDSAKHPKSFVSLDGADHLLGRREDADYVATVLAAWAERYLDVPQTDSAPESVEVHGTKESLAQHIHAGKHHWIVDEPRALGGEDTGPNPYEMLLAALGACTAITLQLYAKRKQWPLEEVKVRLNHERIHAKDCQECEQETGMIDRIDKLLELSGELDSAQKQRLYEIADRCPVHRSLISPTIIRTEHK